MWRWKVENNMMDTIKYIKNKVNSNFDIGIILGSGLGEFANSLEDLVTIPYSDIPGFPMSTVKGHSGELVFGKIFGKDIVCMKGRIHYYEGFTMDEVVFPVKTLCDLGIKKLIVTNAAGGVNESFTTGNLMLIRDHINFAGINPLIGPNREDDGPRFPDMSYAYDSELCELAIKVAKNTNKELKEGVYMYFTGPSYETPAEIRMARVLGADAVGMSTVPEVIIANHRGVKVLGISCITNMAAGILDQALIHEEVVEVSRNVQADFNTLMSSIIEEI